MKKERDEFDQEARKIVLDWRVSGETDLALEASIATALRALKERMQNEAEAERAEASA